MHGDANARIRIITMTGSLKVPIPPETICHRVPGAYLQFRAAHVRIKSTRVIVYPHGKIAATGRTEDKIAASVAAVLAKIHGALVAPMRVVGVCGSVKFERRLDLTKLPGDASPRFPGKKVYIQGAHVTVYPSCALIIGTPSVADFYNVARTVTALVNDVGALLPEPVEKLAGELEGLNVE